MVRFTVMSLKGESAPVYMVWDREQKRLYPVEFSTMAEAKAEANALNRGH